MVCFCGVYGCLLHDSLDRLIVEKFKSGNTVPVERITITHDEARALLEQVKRPLP